MESQRSAEFFMKASVKDNNLSSTPDERGLHPIELIESVQKTSEN